MDYEERPWRKFPWKPRITVSMKLPVAILLVLFALIPMVLCTQTVIVSMSQAQVDDRMARVQSEIRILSDKMMRVNYLSGEGRAAMEGEIQTAADVYDGRIVVVNQDFRIIEDTFHIAENRYHIAETVIRCFQGETSNRYNKEKRYFAVTAPIYASSEDKTVVGALIMTASTESLLSVTESVADKTLLLQCIVMLVAVVAAVTASVFLTKPLRELRVKLNHVAQGALDTDIITDAYQETRDISQEVELTISKLREVDQSRQEFVSNVSHELKTPITSIRVLADSLMGMGDAPVELYREFMEDISVEIDRESNIINDLLTLVKMDKSEAELNVSQVSINALVEQILKRLRPIANKQKVELVFESIREVTADVDEVKISLAISNLVENAVKYNREDGWVRVTLDADHKFFYVKVTDSGIGIPEDVQDRIFDRFYRVDKARSRETGGSGLGLAITRSVVLMHKGAIKLSSKEGEGSTFTLRIPLNYVA